MHGNIVLTYICVCNLILFQRNISSESVDKLEPVGVRSLFYLLWKFLWFSLCVCVIPAPFSSFFTRDNSLNSSCIFPSWWSLWQEVLTVLWAMPPKAEKQHYSYLIASVWTAAQRAEHLVQLAHEGGGCRDWDTFQTSANECKHCSNKDNTAWGNVSSPQKVIESIFSKMMRLTCDHALIALVLWKSGYLDGEEHEGNFVMQSAIFDSVLQSGNDRLLCEHRVDLAWVGTYVCLFSAWSHEVACWLVTPETGRRKQMKGERRDCSCASNYKHARDFVDIPPM